MRSSLDLVQEQKLQQKLSTQQVQFVRLLEMTAPEIEEEVRHVVDDNPALIVESEMPEVECNDTFDKDNNDEGIFNDSPEHLQNDEHEDSDDMSEYRTRISNHSADDASPADIITPDSSANLNDSLIAQLSETNLSDDDRKITEYIIGNIDNNGYLRRNASDIAYDLAMATGYDIAVDHIKKLIGVVRAMEPAGIGAFDLRDCLLIQLDRRLESQPENKAVVTARRIIADHFDLFSKKHYQKICTVMGIDNNTLQEAMSIILRLNPRPGASVVQAGAEDKLHQITPDFSVEPDQFNPDRLVVTLLNRLPELTIEKSYIPDATASHSSNPRIREAQAFIRKKYDDARGFISGLKRRSETLYKVMEAIVAKQDLFFRTYNPATLRPMVLKDIAAATGLDISVISRATAGKYVNTPAGVFPLKMFFSEASTENPDTSLHELLDSLKKLIENEDHRHPLSDNKLCELMNEKGYDIARRTVSKYRERLKIPVARLRKQL